MIDEQHPMQIGLFPMDLKCHTPQQTPQQQTGLLMNGNVGMLTTSTAAATTNGRHIVKSGSATSPLTSTSTSTVTIPVTVTPTATGTATGSTATPSQSRTPTNGNGNCSNKVGIVNDKTNISASVEGLGLGPGPPSTLPVPAPSQPLPPPPPSSSSSPLSSSLSSSSSPSTSMPMSISMSMAMSTGAINVNQQALLPQRNMLTSVSGCALLSECNSNVDEQCGPLCITQDPTLSANTNTHNNNSNNNNNVEHQQQQHSRLQLHTAAEATSLLSHHHLHQINQHHHQPNHLPHPHPHPHPQLQNHSLAVLTCNTNTNIINNNNNNNCNGLSLPLACGGVNHARGLINSADDNGRQCNARASGHLLDVSSIALAQCGYCCQPICDRYIMRVVDTSFHEGCLKCATCSLHLVHSCFARDGKLYCRIDYERIFVRNRCLGCGHKIASDELVMRTLENVFHVKCFACVVCGALLKKGEQYIVKQGQLFCRFDYEKEVEMLQGYDYYGDDLFPPKMDGRRGPKRPRTILNTQQRRAFKASFEVSPKPCRKVRENLAKETGLSLRIVQVWFQNQRAKVKKIQKKAKQEHPKGTSDSQDSQESDSSLAKIKDEAHSDNESLLESPYSSCGGGASGGGGGMGVGVGVGVGVGIGNGNGNGNVNGNGGATFNASMADVNGKLRCIKDENENAPFNCMETNKENCNKTNEPILNTILGLSYATFQQLMGPFTQSPMVNPIDRLYSMQNSYFRPEELNYADCGKEMSEN